MMITCLINYWDHSKSFEIYLKTFFFDSFDTCRNDQDIRPGLLFNRTQKRTHEIYKKKVQEKAKRPKSYHEQEQETREKGLNTAITSDNVGFKLLQKMGYKEGKSLGKGDSGLKEPINVILKESTSGMGREKHLEKMKQKKEKLKEDTLKLREREYLSARYEKTVQNMLRKDFFKGQRVCEELDEREVYFDLFPIRLFLYTAYFLFAGYCRARFSILLD